MIEAGRDKDKFCFVKKKCILQLKFAYAIMAIDKKVVISPCGQRNESPNCIAVQFGDSSFLLYWKSTQ